ncbi:glycosyltransferase WbsX family protein [Geotalea uraniireducens]|uniref:Lipopolysaccharide biosynthesis protein-like protein n=1 Tax=Geotalea uraniireducens (strain Rf4) TaxID=351605 RepID=A5G407_GEOUR|nr:glycoside hydrolase family 99-like domain-containing protein [Geotalea uraniireducens]ABQ26525.1 Lipopolysaccharide biosynthesis protein-like protein [Geotalea uraniireducens Rf4]
MARLIAFYLPQYHPIPENDTWWGKGFTEWTNVAKAKPLFRGHYQPHIPADLGFYDLRVPETRAAQAEMAREYGIEAFCYYHYWFAGRRLLERPFNEVLASGEPDFPFCLCWANQSWTGIWHGAPNRILVEQTYPGFDDYSSHFQELLKAFTDRRYVTVDGKPLFLIFRPKEIPDPMRVIGFWREMAVKAGLKGLYLVGVTEEPDWIPQQLGFDAYVISRHPSIPWITRRTPIKWMIKQYQVKTGKPAIFSYEKDFADLQPIKIAHGDNYPCLLPNWDNTPRSKSNGLVLHDSTPEAFRKHVKKALEISRDKPDERKLVFIKSWNEWAEGNHLEPDLKFGRAYLEILRNEISNEFITRKWQSEDRFSEI